MTVKRLQSGYWDGYALGAQYSELIIGPAATVGGYGVSAKQTATIVNHGTVVSPFGTDIYLPAGGKIINGGPNDTTALLVGESAVVASGRYGDQATLVNFGTVRANNFYSGVGLYGGGVLTNGSNADSRALIAATSEIAVDAVDVRLSNFGTIQGGLAGVLAMNREGGASLVNGSAADTTALILGGASGPSEGVGSRGQAAAIRNFGTIEAASGDGVFLYAGWTLTNGSPKDHAALVSGGYYGVQALAGSVVANFATIAGNGVSLASHGTLVNGSARDSTALVSGKIGVIVGEYGTTGTISNFATVENFGTIEGVGGPSVEFEANGDRLVARAGSMFIGVADVGQSHIDVISGAATFADGIDSGGVVTGAGTVALTGGTTTLGAGTRLNVADVEVIGEATEVDIDHSLFDSRRWTQFAGTLDIGAGDRFTFTGEDNLLSGSLGGAGEIAFVGGSDTWDDLSLSAGEVIVKGAAVAMVGTIADAGALTLVGADLAPSGASRATLAIDAGRVTSLGVSRVAVAIVDDGSVEAASGTLDMAGGVSGAGVMRIASGATLELDGAAGSGVTVTFAGAHATLALATPTKVGATIAGFAAGETIDLLHVAATSARLNALNQLAIFDGETRVGVLRLTAANQGQSFAVASDGNGGSTITVAPGGAVPTPGAFAQAMAGAATSGRAAGAAASAPETTAAPVRLVSPTH
jgi:hypothetical protein